MSKLPLFFLKIDTASAFCELTNDIPSISDIDSQVCPEDNSLTVSLNPIDPDNNLSLSYSVSSEVSDLITIENCLLYTSPSPRDRQKSRMPSSA